MESSFIKQLKKETNKGTTLNGAETLNSSLNPLVDFFAQAGATRNNQELGLKLFLQAFAYDRQKAIRLLFYMRDIRGGQGERVLFRNCLQYLGAVEPGISQKIVEFIPEYGRYDDIFSLPLEICIPLIREQLIKDVESDKPSLLAKWMPSENTSSHDTRALAKIIRESLGATPKEYRKMLSSLRAKIKLVEQQLSSKEFNSIDYSKVPSQASLKYKKAFLRNDGVRYKQFLEKVVKGEVKINASTLYPYQIYQSVHKGESLNTCDALWKSLPDYTQDKNAIVVADTSGSMSGTPMAISVSLALYFAERNKGKFKNHFISFSERPELHEIYGETLIDKMNSIQLGDVANTNIQAVFDLILNTALNNNVPEEELPATIYIISDMEFDSCVQGGTNFELIKNKYIKAGYKLPNIVFWNVDAKQRNIPVEENQPGVTLVSGSSLSTFKLVVEGKTPNDLMEDVVNSERYNKIMI